jgi:hypothetical protein
LRHVKSADGIAVNGQSGSVVRMSVSEPPRMCFNGRLQNDEPYQARHGAQK